LIAEQVFAAGDVLWALVFGDKDHHRTIRGFGLRTGAELFSFAHDTTSGDDFFQLLSVGNGYGLVLGHNKVIALSPKDGHVMWDMKQYPANAGWEGPGLAPVVNNELWYEDGAWDPVTGKRIRSIVGFPTTAARGCFAAAMVNRIFIPKYRYLQMTDASLKYYSYRGMVSGCIIGTVPAEGMLFTTMQNEPYSDSQPFGFVAIAPVGSDPTEAEFIAKRPVERGEAFGANNGAAVAAGDWSMFRGNTARSSASHVPVDSTLHSRWEVSVREEGDNGMIEDSYRSRFQTRLSPPVYGCGNVYVAVADRGEVVALNQRTGKVSWRYRAGSRIETTPTIYKDGCYVGCNDGYVYALSATEGKLLWRVRIAPREQRMVDHGVVESVWPVLGSVLAYNNLLYTSAGRNSESDGGMVIVALDPMTGEQRWARHIDVGVVLRKNDVLRAVNGKVAWNWVRLDAATGECDLTAIRKASGTDIGSAPVHCSWDHAWIYSEPRMYYGLHGNTAGFFRSWTDSLVATQAVVTRGPDTTSTDTAFKAPELTDKKVSAITICPNGVIYGYGGYRAKDGTLLVHTFDKPESREIALSAGIVPDGIAVMNNALAISLENGHVVLMEGSGAAPVATEPVAVRVNCGGPEYQDAKGNVWQADRAYESGKWGAVGGFSNLRQRRKFDVALPLGLKVRYTSEHHNSAWIPGGLAKPISDPDSTMYLTERWGMSAYRFTVPNGRYNVVLHFIEFYLGEDGVYDNSDASWVHRRFDVAVNGEKALAEVDAVQEAGGNYKPLVKKLETEVVNGELEIGFKPVEFNAQVSGIEIVRQE
jgi:outer membrane protein assembly factor BamB